MEAHVGDEARRRTFREQQAAALHELAQLQQAVEAHARAHVVGLVNAAKMRSVGALAIWHRRAGHRTAIQQVGGVATDVGIDDHIEPIEHARVADLLFGNRGVRHAQTIEGVAHPALILRRNPRVHDRDARQRDGVRGDADVGSRRGIQPQRRNAGANGRRIGEQEGAGGIRRGTDRERAVGDAHACASDLPRQHRRAPVAEVRDDQRAARSSDATHDHGIDGEQPHRFRQHGGVGDLERRHVPQQVHRPAGVVVWLRVGWLEALQRQHGARELRVRLIQTHDPVAAGDDHGVMSTGQRERGGRLVDLGALRAEQVHHLRGLGGAALTAWHDERIRRGAQSARDGTFGFGDGILEILLTIVRHVPQRDQDSRLLIIHVAANAPTNAVDGWIGPVPLHRRRGGRQLHVVLAVGAARRVRLVEAADRIVQVRDRQAVVGRPAIVELVREHARQSAARELRDLAVGQREPLVDLDCVVLGVVRTRAGAGVQERHRLVQVVRDRRPPVEEGLEEGARQFERQRHAVTVVVVSDILAPVRHADVGVRRQVQPPVLLVEVHVVVTPVHFPHRDDHRDHVLADAANVLAVVNGEAIQQFDHRLRTPRLGGMQRTAEQVHRLAHTQQFRTFRRRQATRVGQLAQDRLVVIELRNSRFIGDDRHHHLAPFLGLPQAHDLHAIAGRIHRTVVLRRFCAVRKTPDRARHVAQCLQRRRDRGGRRQIVHHVGDELVLRMRRREFSDPCGVG